MKKNKIISLLLLIALIFIVITYIKIVLVYRDATTPIKLKRMVFNAETFVLPQGACAYPFMHNYPEMSPNGIGAVIDSNNKLYGLCVSKKYGFILVPTISSSPQVDYFITQEAQADIEKKIREAGFDIKEGHLRDSPTSSGSPIKVPVKQKH